MLFTKNSIPELALLILRKRLRFRVTGVSMTPLLKPGEEILIDPRAYRHIPPKVGDIVVARHPYQNHLRLVKRVTLVLEDGRCFLKGDNRLESTDSRSFGLVDSQQIIGKVTSRFF
ncbi:MAG: nickel-type superoxide dismutase maturation protease [Moorea sp. SIO3I7]|nr:MULTISPECIES: nickel-type superoxide dismutase maturation protease [Moorena]NEN99873.1 nickel-type superoxide dismutase maturation protease [Moorena sp. SIO3I7]NEO06146.1 nickel-type superoxide dismutase maturation protease [Moorena sp. SIO3I8]NEO18239.1 nickel-type superoxide dismutase maturation protease [Moorena sp. SIO4A5]NEP26932.1 nickel-type superoxide dismutase maturation protease [Moorena sp. SIO3I6]NEQ60253.1 nickel-type superoxide dismutase maturation protease [Moorena sp. SIO4A1